MNKTNVLGDNKELVFASFNEENDLLKSLLEASGGYFGLASATPPPRVERFLALML